MKIFITSIDTQLGYHLTEFLRQDHLLLQGFALISGTRSQVKTSFMLHDSVHQTFDFSKQRDLSVKTALQSDVLIVDLRNDPVPQVQFMLKVLKHYPSKKPLKLVGISNYSTWSNSKTMEFVQNPQDKQALLEQTINKSHWQPVQINKTHYPLRVAHPMFVYNYCLEQQILQLKNVNKMVQPAILCAGLLYGKSGFDLRTHVENAFKGREDWILELKNGKMITEESVLPILHVDRLMQEVEAIVYRKNNEEKQVQVKDYTVLCEDTPKSIVKIVQTINQLCGNTKQLNQLNSPKTEPVKQEKPPMDTLKLPFPTTEQPSSSTQLTNQLQTRITTSTRNRNSSSQGQQITQALTSVFIPQVTFSKDKFRFSMLMNVSFRAGEGSSQEKDKKLMKVKDSDDTYVIKTSQQGNIDDTQVKVKEIDSSSEKLWLQQVVQQYTQYFDCQFKRFLLSEELIKQHQSAYKLPLTFMTRYLVIDRNLLTYELNVLVEKGMIPQERLATPEEDKKKSNNNSKNQQNRQSATKDPYERVFAELMVHVLAKYRLSHFVVFLKSQLIGKLLALFGEQSFEEHKDIKFISITAKEPTAKPPSYPSSQNINKSVPIFSDQFYQLYDIQNPHRQTQLQTQQIKLDEEQTKKSVHKSRSNIQLHKESAVQVEEELKINLLHQYLLDNLIVYLAEAKHNLKAKGKLIDGQKLEGKENIKLFVEELKQIRSRETKLACEEQQ